jgi:hypothetical protein
VGGRSLGVLHLTLTIRHHRRGSGHNVTVRSQREVLESGWRKMLNGRHREKLFAKLGALGAAPVWTARGFEMTFPAESGATVHGHWHVLIGVDEGGQELDDEGLAALREVLADAWLGAVGAESTSMEYGAHVRRVDPREAHDIAEYVAGGGWECSEELSLKSAAWEVGGSGHGKQGKEGRWSLPDLMTELVAGNPHAAALYREYVVATRGLRALVMSNGAKPYRAASPEALADWWAEQVTDVETEDVGEILLPAVVLRSDFALADLVEAAERGMSLTDLQGMADRLEDREWARVLTEWEGSPRFRSREPSP